MQLEPYREPAPPLDADPRARTRAEHAGLLAAACEIGAAETTPAVRRAIETGIGAALDAAGHRQTATGDDGLVAALVAELRRQSEARGEPYLYTDEPSVPDPCAFGVDGLVDLVALAVAVRATLPAGAPAPHDPAAPDAPPDTMPVPGDGPPYKYRPDGRDERRVQLADYVSHEPAEGEVKSSRHR